MIRAENITKKYMGVDGENIVLDKLCFSAREGEFCIVTGQSGCGKSTLLNILSCLDSFDGGTLILNHKNVKELRRKELYDIRRRDIAFIFQGYNLISSLTALENVALCLKYQGVDKKKRNERAKQALLSVGLGHRTEYMPYQMSGGQQQRAAIARALVAAPKILFCDEPTGNLDGESAALVLEKIKELQNTGTLILMITHDRSLLPLADRCLTLKDGKLIG